jgi:predicted enzyme related to lactoylglutathione lyase
MTSDPAASRAFYGRLFGWTAEEAGDEFGGYVNFHRDGVPVAGCMRNTGADDAGRPGPPDVWSVYLAAQDAHATVDAAASHGGEVVVPAMEVAELGSMAVVTDVGGATVGIWQPALHQGFGVVDEPGAATWFELHTRDHDASVAFYRDVFEWDTDAIADAPEFRYTTLGRDDDRLAGIMDASNLLPDGVPAHWSVYFRVADVDAALALVTDLGGAVVAPPEDTPYGRLAQAEDPTGARFKLRAVL